MKSFLQQNTQIPFDNEKIHIPDNIKHIKLDIGLSYNAPHSQKWLDTEQDLLVFGFEPNPLSVQSILNGAQKKHPLHGDPLEKKYINKNFFLIPCALGNRPDNNNVVLYSTENSDIGCSSLYEPNNSQYKTYTVPCFTLKEFFDLFPFDKYPLIEYIKVDAQSSDLEIIKGGAEYISNNVCIITLEPENNQYKNTNNSENEIVQYMNSINFSFLLTNKAQDPTFINNKYLNYKDSIYFYQFG